MRPVLPVLLILALGCGRSAAVKGVGMVFERPERDLGSLQSGEVRTLRFPFRVEGSGVRVDQIVESCGCSASRIVVAGEPWTLGQVFPAGSRGEVVVEWRTAGFTGHKESTLDLIGAGTGLPLRLRFWAELRPWFRSDPDKLILDGVTGTEDTVRRVVVRAGEPFRLLDVMSSVPPWKVRGLPSASAAVEQHFDLVLPAGQGEVGRHQGFLQLRTDGELPYTLPISFEIRPELWTQPGRRLLFGAVAADRRATARIEIGVERGKLALPRVAVEGIDGMAIRVVTLQEGKRYQVVAELPPNLAAGPFAGKIRLSLRHSVDGVETPVEREIQILGVVQGS